MIQFKLASIADLDIITKWVTSQSECDLWSGGCVHYPIDPSQVLSSIRWDESFNYALEVGGNLVGFGQLVKKPGPRYHLCRILVGPSFQGEGYGRILVEKMVEKGLGFSPVSLSLNVHPHNNRAMSLYQSLGFKRINNVVESRNGEFVYMELTQ